MAELLTPIPCLLDSECPGNLVCNVINASAITSAYPGLCGCTAFFGWQSQSGQNLTEDPFCREYGPQTVAWLTGYAVLFVIAMCTCMLVFLGTFRVLRYKMLTLDASSTTIGFLVISSIASSLHMLFVLLSDSSPELAVVFNAGSAEKYQGYTIVERTTLPVFILFITLASFNVGLLWLEIAWRTRNAKVKRVTNLKFYARRLAALEAVMTLAVIIVLAVGYQALTLIVISPFLLLLALVYGRASIALTRELSGIGSSSSKSPVSAGSSFKGSMEGQAAAPQNGVSASAKHRRAIRRIRFTAGVMVTAILGTLAFGMAYSVQYLGFDWRTLFVHNQVSSMSLFLILTWFCILMSQLSVAVYVHLAIASRVQSLRGSSASTGGGNVSEPTSGGSTGAGNAPASVMPGNGSFIQTVAPSEAEP